MHLENTLKIAEACNVTIELHKTKLPKISNRKRRISGTVIRRFMLAGL